MFKFMFCLCLLGAAFLVIAPAFAQDKTAQGTIDYTEVPDEYIQQAQQVYKNCSSHPVKTLYYDCKCFAMRFIEARMDRGPTPSVQSIEFGLQRECRDATEAAGSEYYNCLNNNTLMDPGTDPEVYCSCYANTFVKLIDSRSPILQSKNIGPLRVQAKLRCKDPGLANRLYGGRVY